MMVVWLNNLFKRKRTVSSACISLAEEAQEAVEDFLNTPICNQSGDDDEGFQLQAFPSKAEDLQSIAPTALDDDVRDVAEAFKKNDVTALNRLLGLNEISDDGSDYEWDSFEKCCTGSSSSRREMVPNVRSDKNGTPSLLPFYRKNARQGVSTPSAQALQMNPHGSVSSVSDILASSKYKMACSPADVADVGTAPWNTLLLSKDDVLESNDDTLPSNKSSLCSSDTIFHSAVNSPEMSHYQLESNSP